MSQERALRETEAVEAIRIRREVPRWARQVVSLRNEHSALTDFQGIQMVLRQRTQLQWKLELRPGVAGIFITPDELGRQVVFAFDSESGNLLEVCVLQHRLS